MTRHRETFLRWVMLLNGTLLLVTGLLLATTPEWFYTHLAPFSPFNRHFAGDAGIFSAALGACLLLAVRNPLASPALVAIGASAAIGHAINHLDDHWREPGELSHLIRDAHFLTDMPLFILAGLSLPYPSGLAFTLKATQADLRQYLNQHPQSSFVRWRPVGGRH